MFATMEYVQPLIQCLFAAIPMQTLPSLCNSNHYGVLTQIELKKSIHPLPCKGCLVLRYNYADGSLASSLIENTNRELLFFGGNIEHSWTSWHQHFLSVMNKSIPNTVLRSRRNLPWLNKQLIQAMRRRNYLSRPKSLVIFQNIKWPATKHCSNFVLPNVPTSHS